MASLWQFKDLENGELFTVPGGRLDGVWEKAEEPGIVSNARKVGTNDWAGVGQLVDVEIFTVPAITFGDLAPGDLFTMVWNPGDTQWAPGIWRKTLLDTTLTLNTAQSVGHPVFAPISNDRPVTRFTMKEPAPGERQLWNGRRQY